MPDFPLLLIVFAVIALVVVGVLFVRSKAKPSGSGRGSDINTHVNKD